MRHLPHRSLLALDYLETLGKLCCMRSLLALQQCIIHLLFAVGLLNYYTRQSILYFQARCLKLFGLIALEYTHQLLQLLLYLMCFVHLAHCQFDLRRCRLVNQLQLLIELLKQKYPEYRAGYCLLLELE